MTITDSCFGTISWDGSCTLMKTQSLKLYIRSDLFPGGQFVSDSEARLSIWDVGYTYGYSVYDVARTVKGMPWQIEEHIERFYKSCKMCRLDPRLTPKELLKICDDVCSRNRHLLNTSKGEDFFIWIDATPGEYWYEHARSVSPPKGKGRPTIIVKNSPVDVEWVASKQKTGVHLCTPSNRQAPPNVREPKVKTYSRMSQILAINQAKLVDPDCSPIMLDIWGNLAETHGGNLFLVYEGKLLTPSTNNILEGISRKNVLRLAKQLGIEVIERDLQQFHLCNAEEAFISTTPYFVLPVGKYDGVPVGNGVPGKITRLIAEAWTKWIDYDVTGLTYYGK